MTFQFPTNGDSTFKDYAAAMQWYVGELEKQYQNRPKHPRAKMTVLALSINRIYPK